MRGENLEATEKRAWDMWSHLTTLGQDPGIDHAVADFNADSLLNTTRLAADRSPVLACLSYFVRTPKLECDSASGPNYSNKASSVHL